MSRTAKKRTNFRFRRSGAEPKVHWAVADIPLSGRERAMQRRQLALLLVKCLAVSVAVVMSISFLFKVWGAAYKESGDFQVGDIQFQTNGRLLPREIAAATGIRPDMQLLSVDLGAAQQALAGLPQVREASVERVLPNELSIRVDERQPIAWLKSKRLNIYPRSCDHGRLIDESGILFPCRHLYSEYASLPVIEVPELTEAAPGKALAGRPAQCAVALMNLLRSPKCPEGFRVRQINVANDLAVSVSFDNDMCVQFPLNNPEFEIDRLTKILQISATSGHDVATVNLVPRRNVPVTYFAPVVPADSTPRNDAAEVEQLESIDAEAASGNTTHQAPPEKPVRPERPAAHPIPDPKIVAPPTPPSEEESIKAILRGT